MRKLLLTLCTLLVAAISFGQAAASTSSGPSVIITSGMPTTIVSYDIFVNGSCSITNTGDEPLTNIVITDPTGSLYLNFSELTPDILLPGETADLTFQAGINMCEIQYYLKVVATPQSVASVYSQTEIAYISRTAYNNTVFSHTYVDTNGNAIVDLGDKILYNYETDFLFNSCTIIDYNAVLISQAGPTGLHTATGYHDLTQDDLDLGYVYNDPYYQVDYDCTLIYKGDQTPCINCPYQYLGFYTKLTELLPNTIAGEVKYDINNNNCGSAMPLPWRRVEATTANHSFATYTNESGQYSIKIPNAGTYSTSSPFSVPNFTSSPGAIDIVSSGENMVFGNTNFCVQANTSFNNLSIVMYPITAARPGFDAKYIAVFSNGGSSTISGNLSINYDGSRTSFLNASPAVMSQGSNVLNWNFTDLLPFERRSVLITMQTIAPPVVNLGDILAFTATVNPISGDAQPANNVFALNQVVVNAFDPNDKTVLEGDYISASQATGYLHYLTHFQNTGTASATFVTIKETLDQDLDWSTFEPIQASHPYQVQIIDGDKLSCVFDNINLASMASDEPASHGWFAYRIKPKASFAMGDIANSKSRIFLDYNLPIITNEVSTQLSELKTTAFAAGTFRIYPNPAKEFINIMGTNELNGSYQIFDLNGRQLQSGNFVNDQPIDVSRMQVGCYLIKVMTASGRQTFKFIRQ